MCVVCYQYVWTVADNILPVPNSVNIIYVTDYVLYIYIVYVVIFLFCIFYSIYYYFQWFNFTIEIVLLVHRITVLSITRLYHNFGFSTNLTWSRTPAPLHSKRSMLWTPFWKCVNGRFVDLNKQIDFAIVKSSCTSCPDHTLSATVRFDHWSHTEEIIKHECCAPSVSPRTPRKFNTEIIYAHDSHTTHTNARTRTQNILPQNFELCTIRRTVFHFFTSLVVR